MAILQETVPAEGRAFCRASSWPPLAFSLFSRSLQPVPKYVGNRVDLAPGLHAEEVAVGTAIEIATEAILVMNQEVDHQVQLSHLNAGTYDKIIIVVIIVETRRDQIVLMTGKEDVVMLQRIVIVYVTVMNV